MKKILTCFFPLLLSLFLILSVCGCGKEAESNDEYDTDGNSLLFTSGLVNSLYFDGALYFKSSSFYRSFIDYYVPADNEYGTLCARPECMHDSDSCDGYVIGMKSTQLMMYGGRLYFIDQNPSAGNWQLVSQSPGGRDRRTHLKFDQEFFMGVGVKLSAIYDGTLYMFGNSTGVDDGKSINRAVLYSQSLDGGELETLFEQDLEQPLLVKRVGNTVWFALSRPGELALYSFDLESGELAERFNGAQEQEFSEMFVEGENFLFLSYGSVWELDTSDRTMKERIAFSEPNEHIFMLSRNAVFLLTDQTHYRCVDYSGRLLGEGQIADKEGFALGESMKTPVGCIDGKLYFLAATVFTTPEPYIYFLSYDPAADSFAVIRSGKMQMN